jgi:hypothetical protein
MGVCRQTMDRNNPVHSVIWLPGSEGQFHPLSGRYLRNDVIIMQPLCQWKVLKL